MSVSFARVGSVDSIAAGTATIVRVGRYDVAIFNVDGDFIAYENVCPHQGGPIGEGFIEGGTVTCPWHAWCFDLRRGTLTIGDFARLTRFETRVDDGVLYVAATPSQDAA